MKSYCYTNKGISTLIIKFREVFMRKRRYHLIKVTNKTCATLSTSSKPEKIEKT